MRDFSEIIGERIIFNGKRGIVAAHDGFDVYLCKFSDDSESYFHLEDILEWMVEDVGRLEEKLRKNDKDNKDNIKNKSAIRVIPPILIFEA